MEFFQRQDAHNVFDYLWPNDLLSISSTCHDLRTAVNTYCSNLKQLEASPSTSQADEYPTICRYLRWWLRHCLHCKNEMEISKCLDMKRGFIPHVFKGCTMIPVCKNCVRTCPLLKKITKTEAIKRYSLNEKELSVVPHIATQNPHYRSAAPMKLFYESEVQLAAMKKFKVASRGELSALLDKRHEKRATRTEQMRRNKQLSNAERENELKTELEKHGLQLRSDSRVAESYINNSKRAFPLSQSVDLIRRAHIVHQHVGDYYRRLLDIAYVELKKDFYAGDGDFLEYWEEEKHSAEEKALKLFAKAKNEGTLTEVRKCECGEPLFVAEELEKLEKGSRKKKSQKK